MLLINRLETFVGKATTTSGRVQMLDDLTKVLSLLRGIKIKEILLSYSPHFEILEPLMSKMHIFAEEIWTLTASGNRMEKRQHGKKKKSSSGTAAASDNNTSCGSPSGSPSLPRSFLELSCHSTRPICRLNFSCQNPCNEEGKEEEERRGEKEKTKKKEKRRCCPPLYFPHSLVEGF